MLLMDYVLLYCIEYVLFNFKWISLYLIGIFQIYCRFISLLINANLQHKMFLFKNEEFNNFNTKKLFF